MLRLFVLTLSLLLPDGRYAAAQTPGPPPAGGGSRGASGSSNQQRLDFTVAVAEALDSEPSPELRQRVRNAGRVRGGYSSMLMSTIDYAWASRRITLSATGSGAGRHYPSLGRVLPTSSTASVGTAWRVGSGASIDLRQTASYSPSYLFRLFPNVLSNTLEESVAAAPDYRIDDRKSYAYVSRAAFQFSTRRGHALSISGERSRTDFTNAGTLRPNRDFVTGAANWTQRIGRNGSLTAGYEYREGVLGFGGRAIEQRLRGGAGYSFALSGTRRLSLRFNVAPSMLERTGLPPLVAAPASDDAPTASPDPGADVSAALATGVRYRAEADASATYPLLRSWSITAAYQRRMQYIPILQDPIFSNSGQLTVQGLVTRRIDGTISAGYAESQSAFRRSGPQFETYQGRATLRLALTRSISIYGEYLQYYYDLRRAPDLAPGIPGLFDQRGVRVGVMFWDRLIGR